MNLDRIAELTQKRIDTEWSAEAARDEWEAAIRIAVHEELPVAKIAQAAGISKARVYQIRDRRR